MASLQGATSGAEPFPTVHTTVTHEGPTTTTTTTTSNTLHVPGSPVSRELSNGSRSPDLPSRRPIIGNRQSTIRIRRMPSVLAAAQEAPAPTSSNYGRASPTGSRRRSASEPQQPNLLPTIRTSGDFSGPQAQYMSPVQEETNNTILEQSQPRQQLDQLSPAVSSGRLRSASNATKRGLRRMSSRLSTPSETTQKDNEYESEVTDLLDVVGKMIP